MSEITRTTKLKISLDLDVARRIVGAWTDACNYVSRIAFDNGKLSNAVRLHKLTYAEVRGQFGLPSQIAASTVRHVASKYAALRTAKKIPKRPLQFRHHAV